MDGYGIDLLWLPLGAGGHAVRLNGLVFEAVAARLAHRAPLDLYHAAIEVALPEGRYAIEVGPIPRAPGDERGVVGEGPVGSRITRRLRIFRYELRCWRDGTIPDADEAVDGPQRVSDDPDQARRLVDLVPRVPLPVWGRDELRAGEMWTSNSVTSWLLAEAGVAVDEVQPPAGGRAPGWDAGVSVARREYASGHAEPRRDRCREEA
jgi:hypothetical protein